MERAHRIASVLRTYPLYSGCGTIANHRLTRLIVGPLEPAAWAVVPGGEVFADLSDHVGRAAFFSGDLDRKVTWICSRILRPGDTVLDIGANIGIVTLWMSECVGPHGKVHAFEPNPDIATVLLAAAEKKKATNIILHQVALGSESGTMRLTVPKQNRGSASLVRHHDRVGCDIYDVSVRTVTDTLRAERTGPIRFMKIDVEGFEEHVLRGGAEVLRRNPPDAILFESTEPEKRSDNVNFLRSYGYQIFGVPRCMTSMYLKRLTGREMQDTAFSDLLAIHTGPSLTETKAAVQAID